MKQILDFLAELKVNNNRDWFEANKARYKEVQAQFNAFAEQLIPALVGIDSSLEGVVLKDCIYRIYRDVRFSPNKEPYKTHIGAYFCPLGKKSGYAGYYVHIEPENSLLAVGLHCPEPKVVKSVREEIFSNGDAFVAAIRQAKGFDVEESSKLKRIPTGYPADSPYAEYLKLKEFDLIKPLSVEGNLIETCTRDFASTVAFNALLNRAVKFAHEEM